MKNIVSLFVLSLILLYNVQSVFWDNLDECIEANTTGNAHWVWWWEDAIGTESARESRDFLCVTSAEKDLVLYNIILDEEFSKIDEDADKKLESMEDNKDHYFWPERKAPYFQAPDDIEKIFWVGGDLYKRYVEKCDAGNPDWILAKTFQAISWKTSGLSTQWVSAFFTNWECTQMALAKLTARKHVAYDILSINKDASRRDQKLTYEKLQRWMYDVLFEEFVVNLGYFAELSQKWANKTKKTY